MPDDVDAVVLANGFVGVASAFAGALLSIGDPAAQHAAPLAHLPHQLLLAVPAGLLVTLLTRPDSPKPFWWGGAAAAAGLVAGNVVIVAGVGLAH